MNFGVCDARVLVPNDRLKVIVIILSESEVILNCFGPVEERASDSEVIKRFLVRRCHPTSMDILRIKHEANTLTTVHIRRNDIHQN